MSIADNKAMARRFFEEFDRRDFDAAGRLYSPGALGHLPGAPPLDWAGHVHFAEAFISAFPDLRHVVEDQVADENNVVTRFTALATHKGDLMGIPASGKSISMGGMSWIRIVDGKIAEEWTEFDRIGMLIDIGAAPPPPAGSGTPLPEGKADAPEQLGALSDAAAVVRRWFERVDRGGVPDVDQYVSSRYLDHNPPPFPGLDTGATAVKQAFPVAHVGFGEFHHDIHDQVVEGDKVATRITGYGKHTGEFLGIPATGKEVSMSGISIHRVVDGKMVEHWAHIDVLSLLQQLGAIPS